MAPINHSLPLWKAVALVFLPSLVAFVLLDVAWISLVAVNMFKAVLGPELRETPDPASGALAWVCIVGAVFLFALPTARTVAVALRQGALLGLCIYGCYEFTNLSILNRWTWGLALADTAWGATACGFAAVVQLLLLRKLQG